MTRIIPALADVAERHDALYVDLWGCLHNGVRAFPAAVAALQAFRQGGGTVVLLTNAPRDHGRVARQIARMGVPDDAWDLIVSSGDAAREAMFRGVVGRKVWFMGEPHDEGFFDPIEGMTDAVEIKRVSRDEAEGIVCCGPFDPHADPETWRPDLLACKVRGLKLLCANPDIVVDRGETREWCAGAVARMYEEMGGEALYYGKPHAPIYQLAARRLEELGRPVPAERVLAIGDGIATDIAGAIAEDLDSLFVACGLAAGELCTPEGAVDPEAVRRFLTHHQLAPTYVIARLG